MLLRRAVLVAICGFAFVNARGAEAILVQSSQTRTATVANNATTSVPSTWATPFDSTGSDDQRATGTLVFVSMTNDGRIDLLRHEDFGFSIPSGATIDGIEIFAERQAGSNGVFGRVVLRRGTAPLEISEDETGFWPINTDGTYKFGSTSDLWGTTWTPSIINDSSFGLYYTGRSTNGGQTVAVDSLRIRVWYSEDVTFTALPAAGTTATIALLVLILALSTVALRRRIADRAN